MLAPLWPLVSFFKPFALHFCVLVLRCLYAWNKVQFNSIQFRCTFAIGVTRCTFERDVIRWTFAIDATRWTFAVGVTRCIFVYVLSHNVRDFNDSPGGIVGLLNHELRSWFFAFALRIGFRSHEIFYNDIFYITPHIFRYFIYFIYILDNATYLWS